MMAVPPALFFLFVIALSIHKVFLWLYLDFKCFLYLKNDIGTLIATEMKLQITLWSEVIFVAMFLIHDHIYLCNILPI